ncbi:MAG: sigma-70 family RNA polymerase sigma factor, partial [Myxococcales bacterium]|nr:sigma-70 family RNA polymerase sigma factor [Myxococcales bacterium]
MTASGLVDDAFRHLAAQLVATLVRRVGLEHHEAVEDAVQGAFVAALEHWPHGVPERPSAWLYRVAWNKLLNTFEQGSTRRRLLETRVEPAATDHEPPAVLANELADDLLAMMFVCCHPRLDEPSQLALSLRSLCGLSTAETAQLLLTSEGHVLKRLSRARARLREADIRLEAPSSTALATRLPTVHRVLYLLFTEGHLSSSAALCDQAIRLATLLHAHPVGQAPTTTALIALMTLHRARLGARRGPDGGLLLLEEQDRSAVDADLAATGLSWLARSARGDELCRYHIEAAIVAEHCLAPDLPSTRWERIASSYALLERLAPSPLHRLNRAVALAQVEGPDAGLALLHDLPTAWVEHSWA